MVERMRMKSLIIISVLAAALQIAPVAFTQGGGGRQKGGGGGGGERAGMANLTSDERQKVMNARRTAMQDPSVSSAKEKMTAAGKEFHDALNAAMLKADPSLKPILDKMPKREARSHGQAGEGD
jgi:hypothetical protein